ncbi:hypothetical protein [Herbaspirillum rubrisubalbicans]|uniref:Uncharacterized protein n=1 Tax=Herbaspirillum rubrisubalbicans TaxID=80842 RepID=A0AAD0U9F0_9BURK|nr:hypothetical protein [Herbaspirillum rubrisubalbicans]AYR24716.1 hypothetical protein RC54_13150 [Herbaspirillum rubrisubalbicans]
MNETLTTMIHDASLQKAVATLPLDDGLVLFVYPLVDGVIVGLGGARERATSAKQVLSRRSEDLERYGAWLPAMFNDGSLYVLRRMSSVDAQVLPMDEAALAIAEELLN